MKVIEMRSTPRGRSGGPTPRVPRAKCLLLVVIAAAGSGNGLAAAATARGSSEPARSNALTIELPGQRRRRLVTMRHESPIPAVPERAIRKHEALHGLGSDLVQSGGGI